MFGNAVSGACPLRFWAVHRLLGHNPDFGLLPSARLLAQNAIENLRRPPKYDPPVLIPSLLGDPIRGLTSKQLFPNPRFRAARARRETGEQPASGRSSYGVGSLNEPPKMSLLPKVAGQSCCGAGFGVVGSNWAAARHASMAGQSAALRTSFQTAAP